LDKEKNLARRDEYFPSSMIINFDRIFDDFRKGFDNLFFEPNLMPLTTIRTPIIDIIDEGDMYSIIAEIPGIAKENINVEIAKNTLEIKVEQKTEKNEKKEAYIQQEKGQRSFYQRIILPEEIIADKIEAKLNNGILHITVSKKEPEPTKKIEIK